MTRLEAMRALAEAHRDDKNSDTLRRASIKLLDGVTKIEKLKVAVNRLVDAAVEDSWSGVGDPEEMGPKAQELEEATEALEQILEEVFIHET